MKVYTIIAGVNGVGKSSLTGVLARDKSDLGTIIDTDSITRQHGGSKLNEQRKPFAAYSPALTPE